MSQFKVGDVVQQVKSPHYVGVVVRLPEMWGDDKKQSYVVAPIGKKRNDTFFAEDLKPYPYKTVPASGSPVRTTGDLVTFSLPDSYGHTYDATFYVGPREDMRVVDDVWLYPYINWEDRQTYYGSSHWSEIKKVVKPKLKIGDFVRLAGKASSPVVKITYDRPYKTHVYTLENELFVSETRLTEFVFDEKDKSWSHKDVKPVAKTIEKPESADDLKVGDVVQDRRVDNGDGIGVVLKAEYPRYTVNWVVIDNATADWAEKLVYRDNLKSYFHKSVRNTSYGRNVNCVLNINTIKGKEFYQIAASEVKVIDGTWYYPYVNLQTSELRYGSYYWKDFDERLYPEFSIGDKLVLTSALDIKLITAVSFDIPTKKFSYCVNEGWGYILEEHLSTFKKQGDTWYHPSVLEQKEKNQPLSSDPTITVTVNGEEKVFEPAFKDVWGDCETADLTSVSAKNFDISYVSNPAVKPTPLFYNQILEKPTLDNKLADLDDSVLGKFYILQEGKTVDSTDKVLKSDYWVEKCKIEIGEGVGNVAAISKLDLSDAAKEEEDFSKKLAETLYYADAFGKSVADYYHNALKQQLETSKKVAESVISGFGMPIKDILAPNSVKDTEPKGVKMNLSPVNARVIRLRSVRLLDSLSKKFFLERFPDDVTNFKIVGNLIDSKVPAALVLSLASFSCKHGLPKAPTSIKPIVETLQKEFTEESEAMLTNAQLGVLKLIGDEVISSLVSLVKEHVTDNDV